MSSRYITSHGPFTTLPGMVFGLFSPPPPPPPPPVVDVTAALHLAPFVLAIVIATVLSIVARGKARYPAPPKETKDLPVDVTDELPPVLPPTKSAPRQVPASATPPLVQALVEARRSVQPKDMTGSAVSDAAVQQMLACAPWAPNHGKTEPWRFTVYSGAKKQELLDRTLAWYLARPASFWDEEFKLAASGKPEFPDGQAFKTYYEKAAVDKWGRASHLVCIGVKRQRPVEGKKQFEEWEETCAVACAVQNMHLMATSLKVGAYWSSWYKHYCASDEIVKECFDGLDAAQGDRCLGVFVIGERKPELAIRATRLPTEEIATWKQ